MEKLSAFIVDKRKAFFLIFIIATIFCAASISKVKVNNDITSYPPDTTETRIGLTIMEEEFTTYGSARVMLSNITWDEADRVARRLEGIEGVTEVAFDRTEDHYKDAAALLEVSFDAEADDSRAVDAMRQVEGLTKGYDVSLSSEVGRDISAQLQKEMGLIMLIVAIVVVGVLLLTSKSYMEVPVYLIVFGVAAILNMGTNYWFGTISFITDAIAVVLQLALAIDYAIIFCHRFMDEKDTGLDAREADIAALSKAIIEISSSSLTTISGLVALMLMQLRIGLDMGIVLAKGIVCSMVSVFFLMPGLLMLFSKPIEKTRHGDLMPHILFWGKGVVKTRFILPPIFLLATVACIYFSTSCDYVFTLGAIRGANIPDYQQAANRISDAFGRSNTIAMLVPKGDYDSEGAILRRAEKLPQIRSCIGLANVEAEEGRMITDRLNPRQFAELAGVDVELARLLYQAYGLSREEYGAIFQNPDDYAVPVIKVFNFLLEQKDRGVVTLSDEQEEKVEDLRTRLDAGMAQLEGENWSRLVFNADTDEEGEEPFGLLDELRSIGADYYGDNVILVGNTTNARDLSASFSGDNLKISLLTALFVMVILLFTFKSAGLPVLLVLTIQGSIWMNFSFPYLQGTNMFFLSYLVVSSIQMGATIDYAIVITNRYMELKPVMERKQAIITALDQCFPTVFTSGSIMTMAGVLVGALSTDSTISSVGISLGRGTLISIILVMTVLPQLLLLGDWLIEHTALTLSMSRGKHYGPGAMRLDGHVRGHIEGFVDGEFKGVIRGSVDAVIESKYQGRLRDALPVGEEDVK